MNDKMTHKHEKPKKQEQDEIGLDIQEKVNTENAIEFGFNIKQELLELIFMNNPIKLCKCVGQNTKTQRKKGEGGEHLHQQEPPQRNRGAPPMAGRACSPVENCTFLFYI